MHLGMKKALKLMEKYGPKYLGGNGLYTKGKTLSRLMCFDEDLTFKQNMRAIGAKSTKTLVDLKNTYHLTNKTMRQKREEILQKGWDSSLTAKQLSEKMGIDRNYIYRIAREHSLSFFVHGEAQIRRHFNFETVSYLRERGFTLQSIGRLFNVSRQRVEQMGRKK